MRYVLLIGNDDKNAAPPDPGARWTAIVQGHMRFAEELRASGKMLVASASPRQRGQPGARQGRSTARSMDGPFDETKEGLGGFYLVEATPRRKPSSGREDPAREGGFVDMLLVLGDVPPLIGARPVQPAGGRGHSPPLVCVARVLFDSPRGAARPGTMLWSRSTPTLRGLPTRVRGIPAGVRPGRGLRAPDCATSTPRRRSSRRPCPGPHHWPRSGCPIGRAPGSSDSAASALDHLRRTPREARAERSVRGGAGRDRRGRRRDAIPARSPTTGSG